MGPFCKAAGIYDVPITDPHKNIAWQMVNYQLWWSIGHWITVPRFDQLSLEEPGFESSHRKYTIIRSKQYLWKRREGKRDRECALFEQIRKGIAQFTGNTATTRTPPVPVLNSIFCTIWLCPACDWSNQTSHQSRTILNNFQVNLKKQFWRDKHLISLKNVCQSFLMLIILPIIWCQT